MEKYDDHKLVIYADRFTPAGTDAIPTGKICDVADTPMVSDTKRP